MTPFRAMGGNQCSDGPGGATVLMVVSATAPISASFFHCYLYPSNAASPSGKAGEATAALNMAAASVITPMNATTDVQTITADAQALARSAKTGKVTLPGDLPVTDTQEAISQWLSSKDGVPKATQTYSIWHALTNFPQLIQGTFVNVNTGETFTVWNGDVITVKDANGWTAQFKWQPLSTVQWGLVPNSIHDQNGNVPGTTPPPTTDQLPGATQTITYPDGPTVTITPYDDANSTIMVGDPVDVGGDGALEALLQYA